MRGKTFERGSTALGRTLREVFGLRSLRPGQQEVIARVMTGRSRCGQLFFGDAGSAFGA